MLGCPGLEASKPNVWLPEQNLCLKSRSQGQLPSGATLDHTGTGGPTGALLVNSQHKKSDESFGSLESLGSRLRGRGVVGAKDEGQQLFGDFM